MTSNGIQLGIISAAFALVAVCWFLDAIGWR